MVSQRCINPGSGTAKSVLRGGRKSANAGRKLEKPVIREKHKVTIFKVRIKVALFCFGIKKVKREERRLEEMPDADSSQEIEASN